MLKNAERSEVSSHFTYEEYKRKVKKGPNKDILIFLSVFVFGLVVLLGFAKVLSPNVDVAINVDNEVVTEDEEARMAAIDERLRHLKMEDDGVQVQIDESDMFSPELDEKVVIPNQRKKTVGEVEAEKLIKESIVDNSGKVDDSVKSQSVQKVDVTAAHNNNVSQQAVSSQSAPTSTKPVFSRVVVGYYATEKQAEVAKSILVDAGVSVTPIVKNIGGYYTLQVGSYSTKEAAQAAANNLLKANFPARVIE